MIALRLFFVTVTVTMATLAIALGPAQAEPLSTGHLKPPSSPDPNAGSERAAPPDDRLGHLVFGVQAGAIGLGGAMAPNVASTSLSSNGYAVGGFLGVGIGRSAIFQAFGDTTWFLGPGACGKGCGGQSYTLGLGFSYHLTQALAFDPWGSFGMALRTSNFTVLSPVGKGLSYVEQPFKGVDFARIAFGGDFYPTRYWGFGPFIEADLGANIQWPAPLQPLPQGFSHAARVYAFFQIGLQMTFDPMHRSVPPPVTASRLSASFPGN